MYGTRGNEHLLLSLIIRLNIDKISHEHIQLEKTKPVSEKYPWQETYSYWKLKNSLTCFKHQTKTNKCCANTIRMFLPEVIIVLFDKTTATGDVTKHNCNTTSIIKMIMLFNVILQTIMLFISSRDNRLKTGTFW